MIIEPYLSQRPRPSNGGNISQNGATPGPSWILPEQEEANSITIAPNAAPDTRAWFAGTVSRPYGIGSAGVGPAVHIGP